MATRLYTALDSPAAAPAVTPSASWHNTAQAGGRRDLIFTKVGATMTQGANVHGDGTSGHNILIQQYISPPLAGAQTITGTVKGQWRAREGTGGTSNVMAQMTIRVVSNDGTTVRGTLLAAHTNALSSEWLDTGGQNRKFPLAALSPATLTSVAAQDGDRIVVEIGGRWMSTEATLNAFVRHGTSAVDLTEDETSTFDGSPWVEFSQNLIWKVATASVVASAASTTTITAQRATGATLASAAVTGASSVGRKASSASASAPAASGTTLVGRAGHAVSVNAAVVSATTLDSSAQRFGSVNAAVVAGVTSSSSTSLSAALDAAVVASASSIGRKSAFDSLDAAAVTGATIVGEPVAEEPWTGVEPRVFSQILSRYAPWGSYDCGPASVGAALFLASGGLFKIGRRAKRIETIEKIRSYGGMSDGPSGTSIEQCAAAFRSFDDEFDALGLPAPYMQVVRGGSFSTFHSKLSAGKWALVNVGYGPIDSYHSHAISGTWGFTGSHASIAGELRTVDGVEVVTWIDPLDDGRWSTSSHVDHAGYTPRGPLTIPYSLLREAMEAYHDRGTATYAAFRAAGISEPADSISGTETGTDAPLETHSDYPGRGSWDFYNVTREFHFWPTLASLSILDGRPDELATFSGAVVDADASIVFKNEDVIEATFDGDAIFRGDLIVPAGTYLSAVGPRVYELSAQDFTARLDDNVIDVGGDRPQETARARINWIMSFSTRGITYDNIDPPDQDVDAADLTGQTVREALDAVAADTRSHVYVDWDRDLHFFRTDAVTGDYALDDSAPDYVDSFPFWNFRIEPDSTDFHDRVFIQADKPSRNAWEHDYTWSAANDIPHAERALSDSNLKTAGAVERAGQRDLDEGKSPVVSGQFDVAQPGLVAGTTVHIYPALWPEWEGDYVLTNVEISAVDPHDEGGLAQLRLHVSFRDRRRHRGAPSLPSQVNKLTRQRPPAPDGPACTEIASSDTAPWTELSPVGSSLVFGNSVGWGAANTAWPFTPCGVGAGAWSEPYAAGGYYEFTAPADTGQIEVVVTALGPLTEHGNTRGWDLYISRQLPTLSNRGKIIARDLQNAQNVVLPRALVPWGETFWLTVWPSWSIPKQAFECAIGGGVGPEQTGQLGCGAYSDFPGVLSIDYMARCADAHGYIETSPTEAPDGDRTTFTLPGWDGSFLPSVTRNGVKVQKVSVDADALTFTMQEAPRQGDIVIARYHVSP